MILQALNGVEVGLPISIDFIKELNRQFSPLTQ